MATASQGATTQPHRPATTRATTRPAIARRVTTAPTTQRRLENADKDLSPDLKAAVVALSAEMEQALKDPDHAALRSDSDYFASHSAEVSPSALLNAITRTLNRDPRVDAYVKWQLLSAQKGEFAGNDADRALQLYLRCPAPPPRPGTSAVEQKRLTTEIIIVKQAGVQAYNASWDRTLRLSDLQFTPLLSLRESIYDHLPKTFDSLRAGLLDTDQRMQNGYDSKPFIKKLFKDIRAWAVQAKKPDVGRMSGLVQACSTRDPTKQFIEISFSDKTKISSWRTTTVRFDKKSCETLAADLQQIANAAF